MSFRGELQRSLERDFGRRDVEGHRLLASKCEVAKGPGFERAGQVHQAGGTVEVEGGRVVVGERPRRCPRPARPALASNHSAAATWRAARDGRGSCAYATSRVRTCQNAYSASPSIEEWRAGRTSSLRASSRIASATATGSRPPIAATAPAQNTLPTTAASAEHRLAFRRQRVEAGGDQRSDRIRERDLGARSGATRFHRLRRAGPGHAGAARTPRRRGDCPPLDRGSAPGARRGTTAPRSPRRAARSRHRSAARG